MRLSAPASALDVERAYRLLLGRDPESSEAIAGMEGRPLGELIAQFTGSSEFAENVAPALARNANATPLGRFQRSLTPAELEWGREMASHYGSAPGPDLTAQNVACLLSGLPIPHMQTVALHAGDVVDLYRLLLGRIPESDAVAYALIGVSVRDAVGAFVRSEEFEDRILSPLQLGLEPATELDWADIGPELVAWGTASLPLDPAASRRMHAAATWAQGMDALLSDRELEGLLDQAPSAEIRAWAERSVTATLPVFSVLDRPIRSADVSHAYALILGRDVEPGRAVSDRLGDPLRNLITELLTSQEFEDAVLRPLLLEKQSGRPGHGLAAEPALCRWVLGVFECGETSATGLTRLGLLALVLRRRAVDPRFATPEPRLLRYVAELTSSAVDSGRAFWEAGVVVPRFSAFRRRHVDRLLSTDSHEPRTDALRALKVLDSGLFDPEHYGRTYPDVAAQGCDEVEHYLEHGDAEGRTPNRLFEPHAYRAEAGGRTAPTALEHYLQSGGPPACRYGSVQDLRSKLYGRSAVELTWAQRRAGWGKVTYEAARTVNSARKPFNGEVVFAGPLNVASGLGTSARGYWKALERADMNAKAHAWREGFEHQKHIRDFESLSEIKDGAILILHLNLDLISGMSEKTLPLIERSAYVIGIFYWELNVLYPEWISWLCQFDEVWCPSTFIRDTLTAAAPVEAKVIRPWLDFSTTANAPLMTRRKPYFFYMFDTGSGLGRKNPLALVDAYVREFDQDEGFELVLKAGHVDEQSAAWRALLSRMDGRGDIRVLREHMSAEQLSAEVGGALAYVSPHRSEGLGLTIIEAQAQGVPVIATSWGGARDFTLPVSATVLSYGLVEVGEGSAPYMPGAVWADPDVDDIRRALRLHAGTDMRASGVVDAARQLVHDLFGPANADQARAALAGAMSKLSS